MWGWPGHSSSAFIPAAFSADVFLGSDLALSDFALTISALTSATFSLEATAAVFLLGSTVSFMSFAHAKLPVGTPPTPVAPKIFVRVRLIVGWRLVILFPVR